MNMKISANKQKETTNAGDCQNQKGSALVIAVFVLALVSVFVALALSRTASEAAAVGNEVVEGRTFYAAQGSLEMMTRNFNKVFELKLNPSENDLNDIRNSVEPRLTPQFSFVREVTPTSESEAVTLTDEAFAGLYAIRDNWRLRTTATDTSGIEVELTRNVLNNRIPIFQFGIFNDDDLELYRPPRFAFGGRVHTNQNFFISPGPEGVFFDSRVTAVGHIITQTGRNGYTGYKANDQTKIKNASRVDQQLLPIQGSVLNMTTGGGANVFATNSDYPPSQLNTQFAAQSEKFDGNLKNGVAPLALPIRIIDKSTNLVEVIKRGKRVGDLSNDTTPVTAATQDNDILTAERFTNKTGIRVSLADSKAKLPGCASGTGVAAVPTACGVMLDGHLDGVTVNPLTTGSNLSLLSRGYQPKSMKMSSGSSSLYTPTRVNGERLYMGNVTAGRRVWIKVETVQTNQTTGAIVTKDITEDFLSMGVTEQAPSVVNLKNSDGTDYVTTPQSFNCADTSGCNLNQTTPQTASTGNDSRSVIKIQRFAIPGAPIPGSVYNENLLGRYKNEPTGTTNWLFPKSNYNFVVRFVGTPKNIDKGCLTGCEWVNSTPNSTLEFPTHHKRFRIGDSDGDGDENDEDEDENIKKYAAIVPFPIEMFDTREGTFFDDDTIYRFNATQKKVTRNGVMSMIDIDIANLRRFLRGDFNGLFPNGLKSSDIPQKDGWVLHISDRRGDEDFDGEYDMEDIYGLDKTYGSDGGLPQAGEDVNKNGVLDTDFGGEAPGYDPVIGGARYRYKDDVDADEAAVTDHQYYRRGVRLINGTVVPGIYDAVTASNTRGFTLASENGVYVYGNYNATHVTSVPTTGNTPSENYRPFGKPATATTAAVLAPTHIPASIVADSVTILSNSKYFASGASLPDYANGWNDAKSFSSPYDQGNRRATETTIRFAMISGDTISSIESEPHQGGLSPKLNGGVHNFKRYLERWNDQGGAFKTNLNYSGSLINLFNSHNNNGSFKCCDTVYDPPTRNWVFDGSFLDPARLPPGTPFFQYVQITGFERTNN